MVGPDFLGHPACSPTFLTAPSFLWGDDLSPSCAGVEGLLFNSWPPSKPGQPGALGSQTLERSLLRSFKKKRQKTFIPWWLLDKTAELFLVHNSWICCATLPWFWGHWRAPHPAFPPLREPLGICLNRVFLSHRGKASLTGKEPQLTQGRLWVIYLLFSGSGTS